MRMRVGRIQLAVHRFEACTRFYGGLADLFEMQLTAADSNNQCWTGDSVEIALGRLQYEHPNALLLKPRAGVHHVGLRVPTRDDVDRVYGLSRKLGAEIVLKPQESAWAAPLYYCFCLDDPDGNRLEVAHVPERQNRVPWPPSTGQAE